MLERVLKRRVTKDFAETYEAVSYKKGVSRVLHCLPY